MSTGRVVFFAVLAGVLAGGFARWPGGVPLVWAVGLAVPVAAVVGVGLLFSGPLEPLWAPLPEAPSASGNTQASALAARFAEAATDPYRFRARVQPRLRALVEARLRERWPDLSGVDDPRATALLGAGVEVLTASEMPSAQRITDLLDRLEDPA